jgi:hypothetical protein
MTVVPISRARIVPRLTSRQIVGTVIINKLELHNRWGRLVGVWLLGSYPVGFMVILGLLSTNIAGSTKRSVASGWVFVCYCVGQIAGPQFFKSTQAPAYRSGIVAMLCGFIINLVLNQVLRFLYVRENSKRDKLIAGKTEEELLPMKNESELQGFEDVTDKENVNIPQTPFNGLVANIYRRRCFDMSYKDAKDGPLATILGWQSGS